VAWWEWCQCEFENDCLLENIEQDPAKCLMQFQLAAKRQLPFFAEEFGLDVVEDPDEEG